MISQIAILALISAAFAAELSASDKAESVKAGPITSPWDANAWEPGSERVFWRAGVEKSKTPAAGKTAPSGSVTTPSPAASPNRAPAKSDFSNRQAEK
jgi:hypothetical protein